MGSAAFLHHQQGHICPSQTVGNGTDQGTEDSVGGPGIGLEELLKIPAPDDMDVTILQRPDGGRLGTQGKNAHFPESRSFSEKGKPLALGLSLDGLDPFRLPVDEDMEVSTRLSLMDDEITFAEVPDQAQLENPVVDLLVHLFEKIDFTQKIGTFGAFLDGHQALQR